MEFSIGLLLIFFIALFIILKIIGLGISIIKKTAVLCLLMFLLYAIFVNAEVSQVYSGYIFPYETLTVDKNPFTVSLENNDKLMLKSGSNYFFIDRGDCEKVYNLRFCFGSTMWDIDEKKEKINLTVYSIKPTITITRTTDKSAMLVGDEAEIKTTIANGNGLSAEDFLFTDTFTPEFEITDVHYCSKNNNSVYWSGYIRINDSVKCEYTIKALDEIERSFKAKADYFDGLKMEEKYSDALAIKVSPLLDIKTEFNDTDQKIYLGQTVCLKINLTNRNDEDMNLKYLDIYVPGGLEYLGTATIKTPINSTDYSYLSGGRLTKISSNIYRFSSETMKNNQSKIITPAFKALFVGKSNIYLKAEYETENTVRIKEKISSIEVKTQEVMIHTNLEDKEKFDTGIEKLVRVYIENPIGSSVYFKNLHVRFNTTLSNFSDFYVGRLNESNTVYVLSQRIITPQVSKSARYKFNVIVDYETEFNEKQQKSLEIEIIVEPIAGLSITHSISKSTVESGEEFDVETKVENERQEDISNVKVSDTVYGDFDRTGISSAMININGLDTVSAYKYKMKAPQVSRSTTYKFTTTANYSKDDIKKSAEKTFTITVLPKKLELSITRTIATPLFTGQIADVTYTIENKEDEQLKNILFNFPIQQNFDIIGAKTYFLEKLDPYEKLTIREKHRIRPKINDSQILAPTEFVYSDDLGNIFRKNSSSQNFDVKYSYIDGPAFWINKTVSKQKVNKSESFNVFISVANIGTEKGKIKVTDRGKVRELDISPAEEIEFGYSMQFSEAGIFALEPALAEYTYLGKNITTISNQPAIEVAVSGNIEEKPAAEGLKNETAVQEKPKGFVQQLKDLYMFLKNAIFGD
jgi:hypothetical protein